MLEEATVENRATRRNRCEKRLKYWSTEVLHLACNSFGQSRTHWGQRETSSHDCRQGRILRVQSEGREKFEVASPAALRLFANFRARNFKLNHLHALFFFPNSSFKALLSSPLNNDGLEAASSRRRSKRSSNSALKTSSSVCSTRTSGCYLRTRSQWRVLSVLLLAGVLTPIL